MADNLKQNVNGFYAITQMIFDELNDNKYVNTITMGDLFDVDLNKHTLFPLAHLICNNATLDGNHWVFDFDLLCMDWVEETDNYYQQQGAASTGQEAFSAMDNLAIFKGLDNTQNILQEQLVVINRVTELLRRGDYVKYKQLFELEGNVSCQPFTDRFENKLAGWVASFSVKTPNDMTIC